MYRVWCKFEPNYENPLTGRPGLWRVWRCFKPNEDRPLKSGPVFLAINVSKEYRPGSIIRPHKELNKVLEARRLQA